MICETIPKNLKDVPVSTSIGLSLILVFILYYLKIIKKPCANDYGTIFSSNFFHSDFTHLAVNLFSLYTICILEKDIGSSTFLILIAFSLLFNTLMEYLIHTVYKDLPCSVGFSGVLLSIIAFEIMVSRNVNVFVILGIFAAVALFSIQNKKASFIGHTVGVVSGVVAGLIYRWVEPKSQMARLRNII
jgi:membrane associated rhomboid family serine protease